MMLKLTVKDTLMKTCQTNAPPRPKNLRYAIARRYVFCFSHYLAVNFVFFLLYVKRTVTTCWPWHVEVTRRVWLCEDILVGRFLFCCTECTVTYGSAAPDFQKFWCVSFSKLRWSSIDQSQSSSLSQFNARFMASPEFYGAVDILSKALAGSIFVVFSLSLYNILLSFAFSH